MDNKKQRKLLKKQLLAGIPILVIIYFIFANNFVLFKDESDQILTKSEALNYTIKYQILPGNINKVNTYIDNTKITEPSVMIADGEHKVTIKCGLSSKTKNIYSYNGIIYDTKTKELTQKIDSDKDGLTNEYEDKHNLNKYNTSTTNTDILDNTSVNLNNKSTLTIKSNDCSLDIKGKGNFTNIFLDNVNDSFVTNKTINVVDPVDINSQYEINNKTTNKITSVNIHFNTKGNNNVTIYRFNETDNTYTVMDTTIKDNIASAAINSFGIYGLAYKDKLDLFKNNIELGFVIDNSASLFSKKDYELITDSKFNGNINLLNKDGNQNRIKITKSILENLSDRFKVSVQCFNHSTNQISKMTNNFTNIIEKLNNIIYSYVDFGESKMNKSIEQSIKSFDKDAIEKYIILITDGNNISEKDIKDTYIYNQINNNNIKLIIIKTERANESKINKLANHTHAVIYTLNDNNLLNNILSTISNNNPYASLKINNEETKVKELANLRITQNDLLNINNFRTKENNKIKNNSLSISILQKKLYQNQLDKINIEKLTDENIQAIKNKSINNNKILQLTNYLAHYSLQNKTFDNEYKNILDKTNIKLTKKKVNNRDIEILNMDDLAIDVNNIPLYFDSNESNLITYLDSLQYNHPNEIATTNNINDIILSLNNKEPVIAKLYSHTKIQNILITAIYQDNTDSTKYYIEFADPDYPKILKIASISRTRNPENVMNIDYMNYTNIDILN